MEYSVAAGQLTKTAASVDEPLFIGVVDNRNH